MLPLVDTIAKVISMAPVPYLQPAVETFRVIVSRVDQVQANKRQILTIAEIIAQILFVLNSRSSEYYGEDKWMLKNRREFEELLSRIANFCAKNTGNKFFKSFLDASEVQAEINIMNSQLSLSVDSFQISSQVSLHNYHKKMEVARQEDQAETNLALKQLLEKQDTLLALVGKPNAEPSSPDRTRHHDSTLEEPAENVFTLLGHIQETVTNKKDGGVLQEVLVELRKVSSPPQLPPTEENPVVANLKPGLTAEVLITPLQWKMNTYMRNDLLTQHLHSDQIARFARGIEGSKQFVEYLTTTDDISFQYSALEAFRKDKTVKHFFRSP